MSAPAATVGELVRRAARRVPGRAAVKTRAGVALSYARLDSRTERLANALLGLGLGPGDRIAAWMEDRVEYVELYVAAAKAGLVMVPINARFTAWEAAHIVDDARVSLLVFTPGVAERVAELAVSAAAGVPLVATGPPGDLSALRYEELVAAGAAAPPPAPSADALYMVAYTSGTTGQPKGAMLTHRSVLAIARLNAASYRLSEGSVAALTGSMSFAATVPAHIVTHLHLAGTMVLMGRWDVASLLDTIRRERVTFTYLPSPVIAEFTEAARRDPDAWATLQSVLHSASRAAPEQLRALCDVIGDRFVEGLGMTENSGGLITATTRDDVRGRSDAQDLFRSVGRAAARSRVEVLGDDGAPVPHDGVSIGEIVIRSPALMDGYLGRPQETAETLRGGWCHTGDLGAMDPAGYLYVADRRTDLIVSGGMNVYPSEVERVVLQLPGVRECAVVGVPHERWGQTVVAVVSPQPGGGPSAEAIVAYCTSRLASYKKPTRVLFVDELPKTASLKVRRGAVRALAAAS